MHILRRLWQDQTGGIIVETALLLVLVSLGAFVAWQSLGGTVADMAKSGPWPIVGK